VTRSRAVLFLVPIAIALAIVAFFTSRATGALFDDFELSRTKSKVNT
jgi:hypothetical protein